MLSCSVASCFSLSGMVLAFSSWLMNARLPCSVYRMFHFECSRLIGIIDSRRDARKAFNRPSSSPDHEPSSRELTVLM